MNPVYTAAIAEMEQQRDRLTQAIDTMRALAGGGPVDVGKKSAGGGVISSSPIGGPRA